MQTTPAAAPSRVRALMTGESVQRLLALGALFILLVFFSVVVPHFASTDNYIDILTATAVNGVLAIGVTFVIITGGIDLSVGTAMTFCSVVAGLVSVTLGLPLPLGLLAAFAAGAAGRHRQRHASIAKAKLPPFIATLGMLYVTLRPGPGALGRAARSTSSGTAAVPDLLHEQVRLRHSQHRVGHVRAPPRSPGSLLNKTTFGRYTFALGSNEEATRLSGVNVDRWKITVYAVERPLRRPRRHHHRLTHELGPAGPRHGLRARRHRRGRHRRHVPLPAARAASSGTVIGAFLISTLRSACPSRAFPTSGSR